MTHPPEPTPPNPALARTHFALGVNAAIEAFETGRMVDAALAYAAHGIPVFPVTTDKKVPIPARDRDPNGEPISGTGGFKKATTDEATIRGWWQSRPNALIGVPMGEPSGGWTVDVDTTEDHGGDGVASWSELTAQQGEIVTREHRSATGGPHLIFMWQPIRTSDAAKAIFLLASKSKVQAATSSCRRRSAREGLTRSIGTSILSQRQRG